MLQESVSCPWQKFVVHHRETARFMCHTRRQRNTSGEAMPMPYVMTPNPNLSQTNSTKHNGQCPSCGAMQREALEGAGRRVMN